ncbi:MAG: murein biosynthesis integral membrane protein MurJ [Candidatus Algichlamydia australiensis]|nr:murein biosynthesis integral membrane protein MurJ [Chlamydiales bacterium]
MHASSLRHLRKFFSGTFLSRLTGMVRDLTTVYFFGAHPSVAAFLAAFRFSNVARRLLGEGPFQSAFIPHFEQLRTLGREKDFFRQMNALFVFVLLIFVVGGEILVGVLSSLPSTSSFTIEMLQLMRFLLPGMFFISLYGLNISFHHCHHSFFIPSFSPAICNFIWIGVILLMRDQPAPFAMSVLAKGVFLGYLGQWLLTLPLILRERAGGFEWKISPEIWKFLKFVSLTIIGVGAVQINTLFDTVFAIKADPRGVTYLWNSLRLEQFVLALFGMGAVSTLVPKLTRAVKGGQIQKAQEIFEFCLKRLLLILIPCTFATCILGRSAVSLLYEHGKFTLFDVGQTALCLFGYGFGIIPTVLVMLYSAVFYAKNRALYPSLLAVGMMGLNIGLNAFFVMGLQLGTVSVAIATSICAWIHAGIFAHKLWKEGWRVQNTLWFRLTLVSLAASVCVPAGHFVLQAGIFSLAISVFAYLFRCRELIHFILSFLFIRAIDKNPSESR